MNFGKMIFRLDDEDEGGEGRATNDLTFAENRYDKLTAESERRVRAIESYARCSRLVMLAITAFRVKMV